MLGTTGFSSPGRGRRTPREEDPTIFGYAGSPDTPALNREVFKWVQSLDLSHSLKNVRRDVANGFLVAEILSRYFPQDINMHGFANATSSHYKRDNWNQVIKFCAKQAIPLPIDLVEQTLVGAHGAGEALLESLYEAFTGKKLQRISEPEVLEASQAMPALAPQPIPVKGPGDGGDQAGKMQSIKGNIPAGASIEFGKVKTQPIPGDALKLRSQLSNV
uniref:Calponin-homology (CH) domain-containing protein n=1 Tax=Dunaliella tertiolecta TaxID=3047 RepID=A0A7S3VIG3_DUNTE|mmetsp:Transcript_6782/g.18210  ORF Transcript_6782/g.18210 Transcript_6782/m.18210 type:complete len:218 (-) Transcript_6782:1223-1876(-)